MLLFTRLTCAAFGSSQGERRENYFAEYLV
jgi:hypothetical protein